MVFIHLYFASLTQHMILKFIYVVANISWSFISDKHLPVSQRLLCFLLEVVLL